MIISENEFYKIARFLTMCTLYYHITLTFNLNQVYKFQNKLSK